MKTYLGTNFGHGAAAALLSETGELLCAFEEGKLIGDKDTARFPDAALNLIADGFAGSVDLWAEGWNSKRRLLHKGLLRTLRYVGREPAYLRDSLGKEWRRYWEGVNGYGRWMTRFGPVQATGHHLAHAYSLCAAGLPARSLVLVSDTTAEFASMSTYYFCGRKMMHLGSSPFPHSIGAIYHQLAYHMGFKGRTGPGKLMALAALGEPRFIQELRAIASVEEGLFRVDGTCFSAWKRSGAWLDFAARADTALRDAILASKDRPMQGIDLAASAQAWFAEASWSCLTQTLDALRERRGLDINHIGLAGGAALNCRANGEFQLRAATAGWGTITVSPWSDDSGTAIGAAVWALAQRGGIARIQTSSAFLGYPAAPAAKGATENDVEQAASRLAQGKIVALVSGRFEFGPRALGGRCLLADARDDQLRQQLNVMKSRPQFMPMAPVVLAQDFGRYFNGRGSSSMAWTVPANDDALHEIPGAIHCDGHARVQCLEAGQAPLLERVLHSFRHKTGCGVLLLTSLNGNGEAIPCDRAGAMRIAKRLGAAGMLADDGWLAFRGNCASLAAEATPAD